jgi:hypothetical protein
MALMWNVFARIAESGVLSGAVSQLFEAVVFAHIALTT